MGWVHTSVPANYSKLIKHQMWHCSYTYKLNKHSYNKFMNYVLWNSKNETRRSSGFNKSKINSISHMPTAQSKFNESLLFRHRIGLAQFCDKNNILPILEVLCGLHCVHNNCVIPKLTTCHSKYTLTFINSTEKRNHSIFCLQAPLFCVHFYSLRASFVLQTLSVSPRAPLFPFLLFIQSGNWIRRNKGEKVKVCSS